MRGKWIYLAQRNPRLSREQFIERWLRHRKLGALPEMAAEFQSADYCAVRTDAAGLEGVSDEYDGAGVFTLDSLGSIPVIAKFLKMDYIQADEKRFFTTTSENFSIYCVENIVRDQGDPKAVLIQFLRRKSGMGPAAFARLWHEQHAAALMQNTALRACLGRYIQNLVIAPQPPGYAYDGVGELWFDHIDSIAVHATVLNRLWADSTFIDHKNSLGIVTDLIASRPRKA